MSAGFDPSNVNSSLELKQLFEERLRRPMGISGRFELRLRWFQFFRRQGAKVLVPTGRRIDRLRRHRTECRVTLQGQPVKLRPDGTFTMRFALPDSRQIIPAVATSPDGVEERTIVLAVERNTKALEPMIHEDGE